MKIRILLFAITSAVLISFYANSKSENPFDWIYNDGERIVALIYFVLVFFFQHVLFYLGKFIFIALKNQKYLESEPDRLTKQTVFLTLMFILFVLLYLIIR